VCRDSGVLRHLEAVLAKGPVVDVEVAARLESEEEHTARPVPSTRRRLQGTRVGIKTWQAGTHARQAEACSRTSSISCSLRSSLDGGEAGCASRACDALDWPLRCSGEVADTTMLAASRNPRIAVVTVSSATSASGRSFIVPAGHDLQAGCTHARLSAHRASRLYLARSDELSNLVSRRNWRCLSPLPKSRRP